MVQGPMLLVILLIAIVGIVVIISKFKVYAFRLCLRILVGSAAGINPIEVTKLIMKRLRQHGRKYRSGSSPEPSSVFFWSVPAPR